MAHGDPEILERSRLDLFRRHGLASRTEWLTDDTGRRTAAVVSDGGDRVTLLLHGVLSDAGEWALVAGELDGSRLVIPDWPGSGLSPRAGDVRRVGLRRFAVEWLESVISALDEDQVDIVGSSTGGYMGLVYALANPSRVRRLVPVGSMPGLTEGAPLLFRVFATPLLGRLLLSSQPKDAEANRRQVFSKLVADPDRIPAEMLEADLEAMSLPDAVSSGVDYCRAMFSPVTGQRRSIMLADDLPTLAVPTLLLWGSDDNFVDPAAVEPVVAGVPNARMEQVDGGGHLLTMERPETVAESIRSFLSQ